MRPIHAIKWTLTSQAVKGATQLLQLLILAKLLGPSQYGLVAMTMALTNFALIFSDLGLTSAFIQSQNISSTQRNSLFTCNISLAMIISITLFAAAPIIAIGLSNPEIKDLARLAAPIIFITALGQQVRAAAEKSLNFRPVATIEIIGNLVGFSTTVTLAWIGMGAASIIWGSIVYAAIISAIPWMHFPASIKPKIITSPRIDKHLLTYGINTILNGVLTNLTLNADLFLSARFVSENALGVYSLPRNLTLQIQAIANPPINKASFPIFAKYQDNQEKIKELFKAITSITTTLNSPLYLVLLLYADSIVTLTFGSAWSQSADLLKIFAIWGIMRTCLNPPGTLLLALNQAKSLRNWNFAALTSTCVTIIICAPHGPIAISTGLTILTVSQLTMIWAMLIKKHIKLTLTEYAFEIATPIIFGALSIGSIHWLNPFPITNASELLISTIASIAIYALMCAPLTKKNISILSKQTH